MKKSDASLTFFARGDGATANTGFLRILSKAQQPTVKLVFKPQALPNDPPPSQDLPNDEQTVMVDGVERYFWVEQAGHVKRRRYLRNVLGYDLCGRDIRVITTDDARRYVFLADTDLPRDVTDALPPGSRLSLV